MKSRGRASGGEKMRVRVSQHMARSRAEGHSLSLWERRKRQLSPDCSSGSNIGAVTKRRTSLVKRLYDRDDVTRIRFTRAEPRDPGSLNRNLLEIVDSISPGGSVFHVIADTPDDTGDLMVVVVDGATVIRFELPRLSWESERRTGGQPIGVEIEPLSDFRRRSGQMSHRRLDLIAADAHRAMVTPNGS